jgi:membrane-associated protein
MGDFFSQLFSSDGLRQLISSGGIPLLAAIIFAETGLLVGFFLPGDTLLLMTGLLASTGVITIGLIPVIGILVVAAIIGNSVGYWIGAKAGKKLFERPDSRFFKREHLLKTHAFYEKYGGITMILARFIPIVRTFAPVVAGAVDMDLKKFTLYNIVGGALWITSVTLLGYYVAQSIPGLDKYIYLAIIVVVALSFVAPILHWLRTRKKQAV